MESTHHVGERDAVGGHDERHVERGLEGGLVPTRQTAACVRRLELRDRRDPRLAVQARVLRAVEAAHLVAQDALVLDRELLLAHLKKSTQLLCAFRNYN